MAEAALESLSFEQAVKELEGIVRKLESGASDLETAIADYTRGTQLHQHCEQKLKDAKLKVETIMKAQDGSMKTQPFDAE